MNIIERAAKIAIRAHSGQKRKGDGSPYIVHPFMVALKLVKYNFSDTIIAAALTHDVLEDTNVPESELLKNLGNEVLEIVKTLSEDDSLLWEDRKKKYIEAVRNGPEGVKAVSAADKVHNLESLIKGHEEQGVEIWKKFNRGKEEKLWFESEMLTMLKQTWAHPLVDEFEVLVEQMRALD